MSKPRLTVAEIDHQSAVALPERNLFAVAIGTGGLIAIAVAADVQDVVDVEDNEICVNVAAVVAAAACEQ